MKKFTLIQNAKESINHALSHIKKDQDLSYEDCKRVILDLTHVVELLLKEKLRRAAPSQVFKNAKKGSFTVDIDTAIKRLKHIGTVELSEENLKAIKLVTAKRNDITHYEFEIEKDTFKYLSGQIVSFILQFSDEQLDLNWTDDLQQNSAWKNLIKYKTFYEGLLRNINQKIINDELLVIDCPWCYNETFSVEDEECLVCNAQDIVHECIICNRSFLDAELDEPQDQQLVCKKCKWEEGYASTICERC